MEIGIGSSTAAYACSSLVARFGHALLKNVYDSDFHMTLENIMESEEILLNLL
jgi:hypothetical protein